MAEPRVQDIPWGEPLVGPYEPTPELKRKLRRTYGTVPAGASRLAPVPWVLDAHGFAAAGPIRHASERFQLLAAFVTSQANGCRYCYGAARAGMRILGYSEDFVDKVERVVRSAELDEVDRAVIEFCRALARSNPRPAPEEAERLRALGLSREVLVEIAHVVALVSVANRVATLLSLPMETRVERLGSSPLLGFLRPVVGFFFRRGMRRTAHRSWPEPAAGPFDEVIGALGTTPAASVLRRIVDGAFASPHLSPRTRILMMAVITRALGCGLCEAETRRLARAEGVEDTTFDAVLTDLDAPGLSDLDRRLVSFARESVHYRVDRFQEIGRELMEHVSVEVLIDAAGTAGLANGLVRLGMLARC